jgi:hypothetical protein
MLTSILLLHALLSTPVAEPALSSVCVPAGVLDPDRLQKRAFQEAAAVFIGRIT